jgi:hypothetical protein
MRQAVASLTMMGCLAFQAPALGAGNEAAAGKPGIRACSLLTKELVMQVSPFEQQAPEQRDLHRQLLTELPPEEESVGPSGSACNYGGVYLQIDPFAAPTRTEKDLAQTWVPLSDVGDVAYFRDNRGKWAELYVRAGARVLTIQMDVPEGRTAESIKPNVTALAKAILPKLR